ncbi:MAG: RDD family protein, partial [Phycisphaerales bacterium]|nr:RDD family protein [Phycisphaerales bacterium]
SQIAQMDTALLGVGLAMLLAMVQSVATETFFGRSLGKMAVGLRVYSTAARRAGPEDGAETPTTPVVAELSEPRFWQVMLRNLIRWTIPAVGLLAMFDGGRRHPGDLLGKTIVLSLREPEPPDDGM